MSIVQFTTQAGKRCWWPTTSLVYATSLFGVVACVFAMSMGLLAAMPPRDQMSSEHPEKISPWLRWTLEAQGTSEFLIVLDPAPDLSSADGLTSRSAKGRFVYETMRTTALQSQTPLIDWLAAKGYRVITQFWIVNAILVRGSLALATEVTAFPSVNRIVGNPVVRGLEHLTDLENETPYAGAKTEGATVSETSLRRGEGGDTSSLSLGLDIDSTTSSPEGRDPSSRGGVVSVAGAGEAAECGLNTIHATDVWTLKGVRGEGIVLASMDTGVAWTHPAIQSKYRGWNGGSSDHSYSWHDSIQHTVVPFDDNNHGTHTTGTMVGDDGGANQIGVAPNAKWIACRNMDHGNGQPSTYLECMQWGLAPYPQGADPLRDGRPELAADITNNSWGCPPSEGCDALTLQQAFETLRTAGQMTVAAAGNSGSACSTVSDPPALYDAVFTVGAVDCSSVLRSFSSRGPVTIDGSGRLKPNVAAPGYLTRSSVPGVGYASFSGTSMASPHTAGAMALLWSAKPNLRNLIRISRCYVEQSAGTVTGSTATCGEIPPTTRPNNLWGGGLVNALAAIDLGPDGDSDGIADTCDCAAGNGGVFETPSEVASVGFATNKTDLTWASQSMLAGSGTAYDIVRGSVADLKATTGFAGATCLDNDHTSATVTDNQLPPAADAFYYLVRGQNTCGSGTYGTSSNGVPRAISACP